MAGLVKKTQWQVVDSLVTGHERRVGFGMREDGCSPKTVVMPVFERTAVEEGLCVRSARKKRAEPLGDAAARLGLTTVVLSCIERGRKRVRPFAEFLRRVES